MVRLLVSKYTFQTMLEIRPQKGAQEAFLATKADICFFGGSAGGGKSFSLLMEGLRHIQTVDGFNAIVFRRESVQISNAGGLWDNSVDLYSTLGEPREHVKEWHFPPFNNSISFRHLQLERDVQKYQGSQIAMLGFDELTHFTRKQFMYMLSRNRSTCGIKPYVRAGYNPVPASDPIGGWVHEFVDWYLDENGEYPDPDKAGVIRWFIVVDDTLIWKDNKEDFNDDQFPLSFTFIPSTLQDNQILMDADPTYIAKLNALGTVDRERLLLSNHKIETAEGGMFQREDFEIVDGYPKGGRFYAYIDKAGTQGGGDYTAMLLLYKYKGVYYVVDTIKGQWSAGNREKVIRQTAITWKATYGHVRWFVEQEPGSGGLESADNTVKITLAGFTCKKDKVTGSKELRAEPVASQAAISNVKLVKGKWNIEFLNELLRFPKKPRDLGDALSGAFNGSNSGGRVGVVF